jgi:hypothetical protein
MHCTEFKLQRLGNQNTLQDASNVRRFRSVPDVLVAINVVVS